MEDTSAAASIEAWVLVRQMLDDMTTMVVDDAETDLELVEGLRMLGRVTALCSELSLDVDTEVPWFFPMNSEARYVGGPNPDGEYQLAMIDGNQRYRVRGNRGTSAYLGFQVLAGAGLTPRRMAAYISDFDLAVDDDGTFSFIVATAEPTTAELDGESWVAIPDDASAIVVREYVGDRQRESLALVTIEPLDIVGSPAVPTDKAISEQLTAMAWTLAKLATLHRTVKPELMVRPNELLTAEAADLGSDNTTPDNLYMLGMFRLEPGQTLLLDIEPPATRYWSVTLENIWHECIDVRRRRSSMTNAAAEINDDGSVCVVIGADDPGVTNWLDTGHRHRGFIVLRWLDNPTPPRVQLTVTDATP